MPRPLTFATAALTSGLLLLACGSDGSENANASPDANDTFADQEADADDSLEEPDHEDDHAQDAEAAASASTIASLFSDHLISFDLVDCTLVDGTTSECFQLVFPANPVDEGPYCPETVDSGDGGLTVYDGPTNPGFQGVDADLFDAMEADGFDIVDDDGTVHRLADGVVIDDDAVISEDIKYCLGPVGDAPDPELDITYLLPAEPTFADSNNVVSTTDFELVGLSLDGVPLAGDPPSIWEGPGRGIEGGNIPALDPCGGHIDPDGWYHWHFLAETVNDVLDDHDDHDVECTSIPQAEGTQLIGFANDGFPIYAYDDEPTDLDDCRGTIAATEEFPDGIYHYVASNALAPNVPDCLKGIAAENNFSQASSDGNGETAPAEGEGQGEPPADAGPPPDDAGEGAGPDFSEAAETLGVSVEDLQTALGQPPFDLEEAAAELGVNVEALEAAVPAPPGQP